MRKKLFLIMFTITLFAASLQAGITLNAYDPNYHGLAFGMGLDAFLSVYKARITARYKAKIANTLDPAERDDLTIKMNKALKKLKNKVVKFTQDNKTWDASLIGNEFIKGRGESMVMDEENSVKRFFFFHNGQLAKVVEMGTKPFSDYMFRFSSIYGKPKAVKYRGGQTSKPYRIIWEDNGIRFSIQNMGEPFNCVLLRWARLPEDDQWTAEWKKLHKHSTGINTMVKDITKDTKDNSVDKKMDELLGPDQPDNSKKTPTLKPLLP